MAGKVDKFKCTKCEEEIEAIKTVFWGEILCYKCWERGINKKKVKELREQLWKYLEPYSNNEPKKDLTLEQLREVEQIFKNNYFGETDKRSKEIFNALVRPDEDTHYGPIPLYYCLKKIEQEIRRLKRDSEPHQPVKIRINCPFCNKEFSCEVEKTDPTEKREAKEELNEKMTTHIREVHGEEEREKENTDPNDEEVENKPSVNQKSEQNNQSSASSNKNKLPLPLIIIGILLVSILLVGCFFLFKKHKSKK